MGKTVFQCSVYSGDISVNFYSEINLIDFFSEFDCHKFFPEFSISKNKSTSDFSVYFLNEKKSEIRWYPNKVVATYPVEHMYQGEAILHLAYPFIELQRQRRSEVTIHGAACSLEEKGVLILGKEGSGKTSTLVHLCQNHNAKLISNDLCLVQLNNKIAYLNGGTKFFYLRYISTLKSLPHLINFFYEKRTAPDSWKNKIFLQPKDIDIQVQPKPVNLHKAYLVHVNENQNKVIIKRTGDLADKLYLNETFSRYIRNTCTTFLAGDDYRYMGFVPSFDDEQLYSNRLKILDFLFEDAKLCYISGKSLEISKHIKNEIFQE